MLKPLIEYDFKNKPFLNYENIDSSHNWFNIHSRQFYFVVYTDTDKEDPAVIHVCDTENKNILDNLIYLMIHLNQSQ